MNTKKGIANCIDASALCVRGVLSSVKLAFVGIKSKNMKLYIPIFHFMMIFALFSPVHLDLCQLNSIRIT